MKLYFVLVSSFCLFLRIQCTVAFDFFNFGRKGDAATPVFPRLSAVEIKPLAEEVLRARGMTVGMKERYLVGATDGASSSFECDHGAKRIPPSSVNDGFCDCVDGTDEPGTSACSGLLKDKTSSSTSFQCINKGYKIVQIPSSRVDDAVCDCCDGSDEGSILQCPDMCAVIAAKEIEKLSKLTAAYKTGSVIREQYIKKVEVETTSKAAPLGYLGQEIERQQAAVEALREDKDAETARADERAEQAKSLAAASARTVLGVEQMSQRELVPLLVLLLDLLSLPEHEVNTLADPAYTSGGDSGGIHDDDYRRYDHYDEHKYDESAEDAPADAEPEADVLDDATDQSTPQASEDTPLQAEVSPQVADTTSDCALRTAAGLTGSDGRFAALCALEEQQQLPEARQLLLKIVQSKAAYLEAQLLIGFHAVHGTYDGARDIVRAEVDAASASGAAQSCPAFLANSPAAGSCSISEDLRTIYTQLDASLASSTGGRPAQAKFEEAEGRLRHLEAEKAEAEEAAGYLEKLQGKLAFLALKGQCFDQKDGKFTYSLCMLGDITQRDGEGSHGTRLGAFASVEDGAAGSYVMRFTEGDHCHAFGARKADVDVTCGADNRLLSASEPSTCHYSFVLETPAACTPAFAEVNGLTLA